MRLYELLQKIINRINERHYIKIINTSDVTDYSSSYQYFTPLTSTTEEVSAKGNLSMAVKTVNTFGDRTNYAVRGVLIGKGITQVRVSASVRYLNNETTNVTVQTMLMRVRDESSGQARLSFATAANKIGNERLVHTLATILTVKKGDFICIESFKGIATADIDVIQSYYATQLVVEAIE